MAEGQVQPSSTNVTSAFQTLNINEEKNINVLLLGPSQAGMSTFVNAFANYLSYRNLDAAEKGKLVVVVPSSYTVIGKDGEEHEVQVASESPEDDSCDYDSVRTYSIALNDRKTNLHMVCVPAIKYPSDEDDEDNKVHYEEILSYIAQTETVHAICCILPVNATNDSAFTLFFEQCFNVLLSRLSDQVYKNVIFLFTHSQATYYKTGTSLSSLKKFLNCSENVGLQQKINIEGKNTFYFENNSFMYLAALQENIEFDFDVKKFYNETWNHSYQETLRFIDYITGSDSEKSLTPYSISNNTSVIMARWTIIKLLQPIADILDLIKNNLATLQDRRNFFNVDNDLMSQDVDGKLKIPAFTLQVTSLSQPVTMCANGESNKCALYYTVGNIQTWRMQRCCECCYLKSPPRYLIGDMNLLDCEEMEGDQGDEVDDTTCLQCGCNTYDHMHMYYLTTLKASDTEVGSPSSVMSEQIQLITSEIDNRITEYEYEMKLIVESAAEFVHFLQNEGVASYSDPYEMYIQYLINRENISGNAAGEKNILQMSNFLEYYQKRKNTLETASDLCKRLGNEICLPLGKITPEKILKSVDVLYSLKHTGSKLKELVEVQQLARSQEHKKTFTEISVCCSKDIQHNNSQKHFRNRRNWHEDGGYSDDKNHRGNFRGRGNRGRYGGYRGNFHHNWNPRYNVNMHEPNTNNTQTSQPPAYSQLYPNSCAIGGNLNPQLPTQHQPSGHHLQTGVPYIQVNVINDSVSDGADLKQADSYGCNQGRGGYQRQARGVIKMNRGGFRPNRGRGNRQWNERHQNVSPNQPLNQGNVGTNRNENIGTQRQQPSTYGQRQQLPADNQRQATGHNEKSNRNFNGSQNRARGGQQRAATGANQLMKVSPGHQNTSSNKQKFNQSNERHARVGQRANTNEQSRTTGTRGARSSGSTDRFLQTSTKVTLSQHAIQSIAKRKDKTDCIVM